MTNHEGDVPATDPIAALIEADKLLREHDATRGSAVDAYIWQMDRQILCERWRRLAADAMPAIVAMAEENADLRHKEGVIASELQRTREVNERLRAQLPQGMQHCTIVFEECERGHGHLRGTNWIKHDCGQCEIERLRAELADMHSELDGCHKRLQAAQAQDIEHLKAELAECRSQLVASHGGPWNGLAQQKGNAS